MGFVTLCATLMRNNLGFLKNARDGLFVEMGI